MMTLKLSHLIGDYEEPETISIPGMNQNPIQSPKQFSWSIKQKPNRLVRIFKFGQESKFNAFILDVLEHQAETQHHGRVTLQYPQVKIEVWTHSLGEVTEIDFEWAQAINEIYEGY